MISVLFCRKKVDVSFGVDEFHDVCVNTDHKTVWLNSRIEMALEERRVSVCKIYILY